MGHLRHNSVGFKFSTKWNVNCTWDHFLKMSEEPPATSHAPYEILHARELMGWVDIQGGLFFNIYYKDTRSLLAEF